MRVAIIDYEAGNLTSVQRALAHLGVQAEVTADPARVLQAERVIFPGVGAAESCMASLRAKGLDNALRAAVGAGRPTLGICLGLQLLFERSEEDGGVPCLGLLPGEVIEGRSAARGRQCLKIGVPGLKDAKVRRPGVSWRSTLLPVQVCAGQCVLQPGNSGNAQATYGVWSNRRVRLHPQCRNQARAVHIADEFANLGGRVEVFQDRTHGLRASVKTRRPKGSSGAPSETQRPRTPAGSNRDSAPRKDVRSSKCASTTPRTITGQTTSGGNESRPRVSSMASNLGAKAVV